MRKVKTGPTPYMTALRERILDTAMRFFSERGIRAVKMNDIATNLGISKRTLYEIYENKEVMLLEGVKKYKTENENRLRDIYDSGTDVIDVLLKIYRIKVEDFRRTCPQFYVDLERFPSVQEYFRRDQQQGHERFIGFLRRGVEEGYFRPDLKLDLIASVFSSIMDNVMQKQLYQTYDIEEIFHNVVFVSLRGFSTIEGINRLNELSHFKD